MQITEPEERKWYLAARALTDSLTPEEEQEWQQVLKDENFRVQFEKIRQYWSDAEKFPYLQINVTEDWKHVAGRIRQLKQAERNLFPRVLKYAAAVAAFVIAGVVTWKGIYQSDVVAIATTIEAPKGARTSIMLPDSSHVWLNAESKITFDQQFGKDNRNLTLTGEAFFDVRKSKVPFRVHTADYDIAVLGTAFNVKAYADDDASSTTLVHGSLKATRLNAKGEEEEVLLHPNEKMILKRNMTGQTDYHMVLEKNIDAAAESDWKEGWLTVHGESLGDLSKKIERLYNVKIEFQNENMKSYRYSGRIQQFSLEQVMNALALTSPVRFEIHEKLVKLSIDESAKAKYNMTKP